MRKILSSLASVLVIVSGIVLFTQNAYADVAVPPLNIPYDPSSNLPMYIITGIIVAVVIIVSVIVLNKIRKKK